MNLTITNEQLRCLRQLLRLAMIADTRTTVKTRVLAMVQTGTVDLDGFTSSMLTIFDNTNRVDLEMAFLFFQGHPVVTLEINQEVLALFKYLVGADYSDMYRGDETIKTLVDSQHDGLVLALRCCSSETANSFFGQGTPKGMQ